MAGILIIVQLLSLVLVGVYAEEDCRFNEYTNTKVVSEYAAVLISVESLVDCLNYLKENKITHKVVAFDESTKRCCSVLETLDYTLESGNGWTTFETRVMESNTTSTHKPATSTSAYYTTSNYFDNYLQNVTKGICKELETWLPNGEATFSVYSYDFDLSKNFSLSIPYENYMECYHVITTNVGNSFEFTVQFDQEEIYDFLEVKDQYQSVRFSGEGSFSGALRGNTAYLIWRTDSKNVGKGFSIKVKASSNNWSTLPPITSPNYSTTTNPSNSSKPVTSVIGICENAGTILQPAQSATLSVYSYNYDVCYDLNALTNYTFNMSCNHNIFSSEFGGFEVTVNYLTEINNDYLEISDDIARLRFSGRGMASIRFDGAALRLLWKSDRSVNSKGFCLSVRALNSTAISKAITANEMVPSDNAASRREETQAADKTTGMCEVETTWLSVDQTATIAAFSYSGDACLDLKKLSRSTANMACHHEIRSTGNTGFSLSVHYKTSLFASAIGISDGKEMFQFSGEGDYDYSTTGQAVKLFWRTDATDEPTTFCVKVTAI